MKVTSLKIRNVGVIADTAIEINQPLSVFYGDIRQGKTTILNAVRWVCGGTWPTDIIRHGEKEASIELGLDNGCVTRSWYRNKEGVTTARAAQFIRAGKPVSNPVAELKRLMNPFLLDQDFLRNKTELERKQYFSELFAVDTAGLDAELASAKLKAETLRAKLTGYGEIDLTPVQKVDVAEVQATLNQLRQQNAEKSRQNQVHSTAKGYIQETVGQIEALEKEIADLRKELIAAQQALEENPIVELVDTSKIEAQLLQASYDNAKAEQYEKNLKRNAERLADEASLKALEDRQRQLKKDKIAALAKASETCGVPGLTFEENGTFNFEGTQAGMLSTSQLMRLSSLISALYPEGLSIELLDRGESLGRSIFDYVKLAQSKNISVLATVVGQKPADIPEKVGVFVVKDGVVMPEK